MRAMTETGDCGHRRSQAGLRASVGSCAIKLLPLPSMPLEADGRVVGWNVAAAALPSRAEFPVSACGRLAARRPTHVPLLAVAMALSLDGARQREAWPEIVRFTGSQDVPVPTALFRPLEYGRPGDLSLLTCFLDWSYMPTINPFLPTNGLGLTGMQATVVALLALGFDTRGIADHTGLAFETVRRHLDVACARLGVHSQAQHAIHARRLSGMPSIPDHHPIRLNYPLRQKDEMVSMQVSFSQERRVH